MLEIGVVPLISSDHTGDLSHPPILPSSNHHSLRLGTKKLIKFTLMPPLGGSDRWHRHTTRVFLGETTSSASVSDRWGYTMRQSCRIRFITLLQYISPVCLVYKNICVYIYNCYNIKYTII
jgi:hypothetical protein